MVPSSLRQWSIAAVIAVVIDSLPDIKRYLEIREM